MFKQKSAKPEIDSRQHRGPAQLQPNQEFQFNLEQQMVYLIGHRTRQTSHPLWKLSTLTVVTFRHGGLIIGSNYGASSITSPAPSATRAWWEGGLDDATRKWIVTLFFPNRAVLTEANGIGLFFLGEHETRTRIMTIYDASLYSCFPFQMERWPTVFNVLATSSMYLLVMKR